MSRALLLSIAATVSALVLGGRPRAQTAQPVQPVQAAPVSLGAPPSVSPNAPSAYQTLLPPEGRAALVPLGDVAGAVVLTLPDSLPNPFAGQPEAVKEGQLLFNKMNCAGCHNYDGTGGMGPNLTDKYWRYGGTPVSIYKTLWEGRPQGMPAWSGALPPDSLWKVVAFVESLGGTVPATDYYRQRRGDRPGDLVAPEVEAEDRALRMEAQRASGQQPAPAPGK